MKNLTILIVIISINQIISNNSIETSDLCRYDLNGFKCNENEEFSFECTKQFCTKNINDCLLFSNYHYLMKKTNRCLADLFKSKIENCY
jgi:hypothetical protein